MGIFFQWKLPVSAETMAYQIPLVNYIEAMSVFAAVTASLIKVLAEKTGCFHMFSTTGHIWRRETGNRDTAADGLTKQ